jgi:hypothetical protein
MRSRQKRISFGRRAGGLKVNPVKGAEDNKHWKKSWRNQK